MNNIKEAIAKCLETNKIAYEFSEENDFFHFMVQHEKCDVEIHIHYDNDLRIALVIAFLTQKLNPESLASFFPVLNDLNSQYTFSTLTVDSTQSILSSRVALTAINTLMPEEMIHCALSCAIDGIASSFDTIAPFLSTKAEEAHV